MKQSRIDIWCRDLGISGDARKLLILFADNGDATMEEMVACLFAEREDGGPDDVENNVRQTIFRLRKKLVGRAEIPRRSLYELKVIGVDEET